MKYKNVFGELEFNLGNFFVPHRTGGTGKYVILKHEPWYVTDAMITHDEHGAYFWETIPPFDSWIQAIRFLKENYKDLL